MHAFPIATPGLQIGTSVLSVESESDGVAAVFEPGSNASSTVAAAAS
jgi:hypothetical protein